MAKKNLTNFSALLLQGFRTPQNSRAAKRGGFQTGGFPDLDLSFLFCPFWDFPDFSGIFPICSGMVLGFSRFIPFLFLGLLRAPTRNSRERVRDTIWTFPEKSGKPPGLETPQLSFSQKIHAHDSRPELSAFLSNFTFSNPLFFHADCLLTGETKKFQSQREIFQSRKCAMLDFCTTKFCGQNHLC